MIFIHTALLCEAQAIIEYYNLQKESNSPKIYTNDTIVLAVSGVGKINTVKTLKFIVANYNDITKAINIGIAGCSKMYSSIGDFYITNRHINDLFNKPLKTVMNAQNCDDNLNILYDMEGVYFEDFMANYIKIEYIYVLKIVSDHLDDTILRKDYIKSLVSLNINQLNTIICRVN